MATYYIDSVNGNNANDGALATPKQTQLGFASAPAIGLVDGDRIGYMNNASHVWALNANEYTITKAVTIFGCTTAGAAANATIGTAATGARRHILAGAGSAITWENIIFEASLSPTDNVVYDLIRYNASTGLMSFRGCQFLGSPLGGSTPANIRRLVNTITNPGNVPLASFYRCYFQNTPTFGAWNTANQETFEECVFIGDLTSLTWFTKGITGGTFTAHHNTWYVVPSTITGAIGAPITLNNTSGTGTVVCNSNIVYMNSTNASSLIGFMRDSSGAGAVTDTIGYNVLIGGPDVVLADIYTNGWYERNYDPDNNDATGDDTYPTDVEDYGVADTTLFNAPSSSFAWTTVNDLTITLPKDLRPRLYLTASSTGGVPGALPPAETDYSVAVTTSQTAPDPDDALTLTVTYANTGTAATSCVASAPIPAGLTFVSATPSQGTYLAGTWTIGSVASGGSATLELAVTVDSDQAGEDIVFTASHVSGDPANDPDSSDNTDSLTLTVQVDEETEGSGTIPYLDVAPIYAPVLKAEINASIYTKRNRIRHNQVRRDYENTWREFTGRRITVAPSTTLQLVSGIERAAFLVLESTGDVLVSVSEGDTDKYFPPADRLAVLASDISVIKLSNPSASTAVDVLILVID